MSCTPLPKLIRQSPNCTAHIGRKCHARRIANLATFRIPDVSNEPNKTYISGSSERLALDSAISAFKSNQPHKIPAVIDGQQVFSSASEHQVNPAHHAQHIATWSKVSKNQVTSAIRSALDTRPVWQAMPFADRAAIFLKAADLLSTKYRADILAATMLGQGKNAFQAEIDAASELCDFLRFNVKYAQEMYAQQPMHNSPGVWNRVEYRPLEGFVYAITPFNFTAIAGNLPCAPALMGNVVIWKPSPSAMASNWLLYRILLEAGLPHGVIQFVTGDAQQISDVVLAHSDLAALHFTGSTAVFRSLYGQIASGVAESRYKGYPRIVGETGGKNFHLWHHSADIRTAVVNTVRGAFEYQGQKCSACSRAYIPCSLWPAASKSLVDETRQLKIGDPSDHANFIGPVIHRQSFDKLSKVIDDARSNSELECIVGGKYDDSEGYYIHPTIYKTTNPDHPLLRQELFGPVLCVYVYEDHANDAQRAEQAFDSICRIIDSNTEYALTGAVFAQDRAAIRRAEEALRDAAGNFYINVKCTGAVVGQQPFGGSRESGTNDKAGSANLLSRFVSARAIKEEFVGAEQVLYPSNA